MGLPDLYIPQVDDIARRSPDHGTLHAMGRPRAGQHGQGDLVRPVRSPTEIERGDS